MNELAPKEAGGEFLLYQTEEGQPSKSIALGLHGNYEYVSVRKQ